MIGGGAAPVDGRCRADLVGDRQDFREIHQAVGHADADREDEADREHGRRDVPDALAGGVALDLRGRDDRLDAGHRDRGLHLPAGPVQRQRTDDEPGAQRRQDHDRRVGAGRQVDADHHVRLEADGGEEGGEPLDPPVRLAIGVTRAEARHVR